MTMKYEAPKFELLTKRTIELPFISNIGAGAYLSIVSGRLMFPFRIIQVKMIFTDDANNLVRHGWYYSANESISATGPPSGDNIFGRESPTAYFIGDNIIRIVNTNIEIEETGIFIKLYTFNGLGAAYNINCSIVIQEL